jgi:hypothetical protein
MGEIRAAQSALAHCPSRYSPGAAIWMHSEIAEFRDSSARKIHRDGGVARPRARAQSNR